MTQILLDLANRPTTPRDGAAPVGGSDDGVFAERLQDATSDAAPPAEEAAPAPVASQERPTDQGAEGESQADPVDAPPAIATDETDADTLQDDLSEELDAVDASAVEVSAVDVLAIVVPEQVESFDTAAVDPAGEAAAAETIVVDPAASTPASPAANSGQLGSDEGPAEDAPITPPPTALDDQAEDRQRSADAPIEQQTVSGGEQVTEENETPAPSVNTQAASLQQQADTEELRPRLPAGSAAEPASAAADTEANEASAANSETQAGGRGGVEALGVSASVTSTVNTAGASGDSAEAADNTVEAVEPNTNGRADQAPATQERSDGAGETNFSRIAAGRIGQPTGADAADESGPRVDAARFVSRVSGAFRAAEERGGEVRLRLSPPELGVLQIKLTVSEGVLNASLETENTAARNAILDNLPALRERLAEQEIRIEKFDVDVRDEGGGRDAPDFSPGGRREREGNGAPVIQSRSASGSDAGDQPSPLNQTIDESRINVVA